MEAGPQHAHRNGGGDAVQVLPRHQASFFHRLLIPPHTDQVGRMVLLDPGPAAGNDLLNRPHPKARKIFLDHGIVEHVHMGLREAGQHHGPL